MKYIITHPGSAHKDDFLASSIVIAEHEIPIFRRDPTPEELDDPEICIIDVGEQHDPGRLNFDHHQFPADHSPVCALSLVLQHLGLYDDAKSFCPWLETAEWLDVRGARQTATWMNIEPYAVVQLSSPIDFSILRYFSQEADIQPGHLIWQLMKRIGGDLLSYLRSLRANINALGEHVESWMIDDLEICYLPRVEGLSTEAEEALDMYVREQPRTIIGTVSPDKRGTGFGLCRFDDDLRLDFTRIGDEPDVHFAHRQGFIAKTGATDPERLKALLKMALKRPDDEG
ncbi:MAG: MYG1 family protein [Verrucomicrobiota bacterium]